MRLRRSGGPRLCIGAAILVALGAAGSAAENPAGAARVVAIGDVHGDYAQLLTVLRDAGLVDEKLSWAGGRSQLVQTGDRLDRGTEGRQVMDLLMRLEKQARKAGGRVSPLIGNHEAMNVLGEWRDVDPAEFAAFQAPNARRLREKLWERLREERRRNGRPAPTEEDRKAFEAEIPLGWVERRQAFAPQGTYGSWLCRQDSVVRIDDTLFLHGGLSPKYADFSLSDLNDAIRRELKAADRPSALVSLDPDGPLWYRGLAHGDAALAPHVDALLRRHEVKRIVVGHTPTEGLVMPLFGGRVVAIDVGLAAVYGGPPAALLLEEGRAFALHRGRRVALPTGEGEPLVRYVREVAALERDPARLEALAQRLEAAATPAPTP